MPWDTCPDVLGRVAATTVPAAILQSEISTEQIKTLILLTPVNKGNGMGGRPGDQRPFFSEENVQKFRNKPKRHTKAFK